MPAMFIVTQVSQTTAGPVKKCMGCGPGFSGSNIHVHCDCVGVETFYISFQIAGANICGMAAHQDLIPSLQLVLFVLVHF